VQCNILAWVEEMNTIDQKEDVEQSNTHQALILGLTLGEEIIQFNKEIERLTGYMRDEVLHKKLGEILLPKESFELWKTLLESIRQTLWVDDFVLPIKTKYDKTYMISWTGFLIKDEKGSIKDICLFGKPPKTEIINKQSTSILTTAPIQLKEEDGQIIAPEPLPQPKKREMPMKQAQKKIMFASEKKTQDEPINNAGEVYLEKPLETMKNIVQNTSEQLNSMNKSLKELSRKYDTVSRRLSELEKKDRRLEKNHKNLGKHMQLLEDGYRRHTKKQKNLKNTTFAEEPHKNAEFTFFSDPFGFKRQNNELALKKQQVEVRTNQLEAFEAQFMNERKTFNARVEEFSRWREKLELLESAIEKRRQELIKQENVLLERAPSTTLEPICRKPESVKSTVLPVTSNYHELLDKIPQSAAIVQRGILKQINSSFVSLLGYAMDEVVEKNFFDFIALEGLADVEKYYLDRLKGENVTAYKTVFSTKDNNKISVEISIKQTIYNGEKAEIAIISCLDQQETQPMDDPALKK
jgi:PAS domain S-box-containing protein